MDRRSFFRNLLIKGLEKAEEQQQKLVDRFNAAFDATQRRMDGIGEKSVLPGGDARPALPPVEGAVPQGTAGGAGGELPEAMRLRFLRPPGAGPDLADVCSKCGECQRVCPAQCIQMDEEVGGGFPFIVARQSPCVVCDDLSCMKHCPTGALKLVERTEIRMGRAEIDHQRCLRHPDPAAGFNLSEDCRICVTQCPIGETALGITTDGHLEVRSGCTGCGICERACPTEPASIIVVPA